MLPYLIVFILQAWSSENNFCFWQLEQAPVLLYAQRCTVLLMKRRCGQPNKRAGIVVVHFVFSAAARECICSVYLPDFRNDALLSSERILSLNETIIYDWYEYRIHFICISMMANMNLALSGTIWILPRAIIMRQ